MNSTPNDYGFSFTGKTQWRLGLYDYAVHRGYAVRGANNEGLELGLLDSVEHRRSDKGVEFIEPIESDDRNSHLCSVM